jgi:hypothetical protein
MKNSKLSENDLIIRVRKIEQNLFQADVYNVKTGLKIIALEKTKIKAIEAAKNFLIKSMKYART